MSLLGLDVGTTGCKALVISGSGDILGAAYREYPMLHPSEGRAELDPLAVWGAVRDVIRESAASADGDPVQAVSISSHGESITPVDRNGSPLARTIASLDTRTVGMADAWESRYGRERLQNLTGIPLHHKHSINRIMWLNEHIPAVRERVWKFLCFEDWILFKLGLEPVISPSLAARTMAYDAAGGGWACEILDLAGIGPGQLARIQPSGQAVGTIPPAIAEDLNLAGGVVAVTGGHDQPCSALGVGVVSPGPAVDSIGTVEALTTVVDAEANAGGLLGLGYPRYPHAVPDSMVTMAVNPNGGSLFRWYRDNLSGEEAHGIGPDGRNAYERIVAQCSGRSSGVFVLPFLAGSGTPQPDPTLSGTIVGLKLGTTRHDIAWALLESQAFELKRNVEALDGLGLNLTELLAVGGGSRSPALMQLRADVLNLPVSAPEISEAACLGAAMLAGCGVGVYRSPLEAANAVVKKGRLLEPGTRSAREYADRYRHYCRICEAMAQVNIAVSRRCLG